MSAISAIVVTGASGCLGRAVVQGGLRRGMTVLVVTRASANPFPSHPGAVHIPNIDLASTTGASRLAAEVVDSISTSKFAVANCVGTFPGYGAIADIDGDKAEHVFRSNLLAVYNTAHALLPLMCNAGGGHFAAFTSHSRYQAYPLMAAFDAAKAGLAQLIRHIANEHSQHGVVANTLALATLLTDAERKLKPHGDHSAWLRPEYVSDALYWLLDAPGVAVNGNELHLFNYSESYFHSAYFERITPLRESQDAD